MFCRAQEQASKTWSWYKSKDDSYIFDLFVGQLESALKCSECRNVSLTFDPFWDLSLPISKVSLVLFYSVIILLRVVVQFNVEFNFKRLKVPLSFSIPRFNLYGRFGLLL